MVVVVQPSTTLIVYLLAIITLWAGGRFWDRRRARQGQAALLWWGIALLLWGAGALLAGTSYEAFSYALKCAGREACVWTTWLEVVYLGLSVASVDAMLVGVAYACADGRLRRWLVGGALAHIAAYLLLIGVGAFIPIRFLISFELLILAAAPIIAVLLFLNGWRWWKHRQRVDGVLLAAWGGLVVTIAAYFAYYLSGLTQTLWAGGLWFSDNDVLHLGLIGWMFYLALVVAPEL